VTPSELAALDHKHLWHPFTQHALWSKSDPVVIASASGCELVDVRGDTYLDGVSSLWVSVHGHGHHRVDAAIHKQLAAVAHSTFLGLTHEPGILLAAALVERTPTRLARVFFSDSGSSAVEVALKMAFQAQQQWGNTERTRFASLREGYHGDTLGAVSVGGIDLFHRVYEPLLFHTLQLDSPTFREREDALAEAAVQAIQAEGESLAALIVEPLVQGAAGMRMHSPAYLNPVLQAARDVGALVILDEVATGFGRTGTLFAAEQLKVQPDLLCLGKGLTNGTLPLSATLASEQVFEAFVGKPGHTFFHGHTYAANPTACAAALACLEVFDAEDTLEKMPARSALLANRLAGLAELPWVHQVRQKGLMVGIEIRQPDGTPHRSELRVGQRICQAIRRHGVIIRPLGDVLVLMPALAMEEPDLDRLVRATRLGLMDTMRG
jgi:adenosylmethionine-8-amino-7-oxononanoate aminotransferase